MIDQVLKEDVSPQAQLTPKKTLGFKVTGQFGTNQMKNMKRFMNHHINTGQQLFSSAEEEEMTAHLYKPRSTSFQLFKRGCETPAMEYKSPIPPTKGEKDFKEKKELYVNLLKPEMYHNKFPKCEEEVQPHMCLVKERYVNCLAAAVYDRRDDVLAYLEMNPISFDSGTIETEVEISDGSDGYGGLKLLTKKTDRENPDHGITMDFSIHRIFVKPNKIVKRISRASKSPPAKIQLLHCSFIDEEQSINTPIPERSSKSKIKMGTLQEDEDDELGWVLLIMRNTSLEIWLMLLKEKKWKIKLRERRRRLLMVFILLTKKEKLRVL